MTIELHLQVDNLKQQTSGESIKMADNQLNSVLLAKLKCAACPRMVFPPISGCLRDHVVCCYCLVYIKSCPDPCKEVLIDRPLLNSLASCLRYPCYYACGSSFTSGEIGRHEATCMYRPTECPVLDCDSHIKLPNFIDHFNRKHKENIVTKSAAADKSILPASRKPYDVFLMVYDANTMFWIFTYCDNGLVDVVMKLITNGTLHKFYIQYKNDFTDVTSYGRIFRHNESCVNYQQDRNYYVKIPLECLDVFTVIFISFNLVGTNALKIESALLRTLVSKMQCPVCMKCFKSPIYMCSNGHSICGLCKPRVTTCPICRAAYNQRQQTGILRNYTLETLLEVFYNENLITPDST